MPREDRRFTGDDVERIFRTNLGPRARERVRRDICGRTKESDFLDFFPDFLRIVGRIPGPVGAAARTLEGASAIVIPILRRLGA